MKGKILFLLALVAAIGWLSGAATFAQTTTTTEEILIPTQYEGWYLVPFSETNPPPPDLVKEPPPPDTVSPPPVSAPPTETKTTPTKSAPTTAPTSAPRPAATQPTVALPETISSAATPSAALPAAAVPATTTALKDLPKVIGKKIVTATAENKIVKNLPTPRSLEFTAENAKQQARLSLWLFLLVGLSATVINEVVKKFNESPNRFRSWLQNKLGAASGFWLKRSLVRKLTVLLALLGYGALIVVAEAPETLANGLATLAPVLVAALIFLLIKEGGEKIFLARGGAKSLLIFSGSGLFILVLGVLLSRGVKLLPPLLLSAPIILASWGAGDKNGARAKIKTVALTLLALAAFWFSTYINNSVWQGAALLIAAIGIQDLFFCLIPLNPLPGHEIFKTSFWTWLILFVLTTFGFVFLVITPNNATGALTIPWTSAAIYASAAAVIWLGLKILGRRTPANSQ